MKRRLWSRRVMRYRVKLAYAVLAAALVLLCVPRGLCWAHPLGFSSGSLRLEAAPGRANVELELVLDAPTTAAVRHEDELSTRISNEVHLEQDSGDLRPRLTVLALGSGERGEDIVRLTADVDATSPVRLATSAAFGELSLQVYRTGTPSQHIQVPAGSSIDVAWSWSPADEVPESNDARGATGSSGVSAASTPSHDVSWTLASSVGNGFRHILPLGLDHVAFVLGLFFARRHASKLALDLTLFTLAHSLTLAMAAMGWVEVPSSLTEPLIAASIVAVALEPRWRHRKAGVAAQAELPRRLVIFTFGLLHGLGFASVFGRHISPGWEFVRALVGFNLGVELGQLAVVAFAVGVCAPFRRRPWYEQRLVPAATTAIAVLGGLWFLERILA